AAGGQLDHVRTLSDDLARLAPGPPTVSQGRFRRRAALFRAATQNGGGAIATARRAESVSLRVFRIGETERTPPGPRLRPCVTRGVTQAVAARSQAPDRLGPHATRCRCLADTRERGAQLRREELGLLPGGEVAPSLGLVEVDEVVVGLLHPMTGGL